MKNRREVHAAEQGDYLRASWYAADHYARLASWAKRQIRQGHAVNFTHYDAR